jgi:uracil-DNA glycosylase
MGKAIRENIKDIKDGENTELDQTLSLWINQGVFLLNSSMTTEIGKTRAHTFLWSQFTDYIISLISELKKKRSVYSMGSRCIIKKRFD